MDKRNLRLGTLWNLAGNFIYAICIWLLTFVIAKHSPNDKYTDAAVFAVATSFGVIFIVISNYGLRAFQVSDSIGAYTDGEYIASRLITILLGGVLCFIFSLLMHYSVYQIASINLYMLYQNTYAYSDVLHGILQKEGHIDICGKSLSLRGVLCAIFFAVTLYLTNDLIISLGAFAVAGFVIIAVYDFIYTRRYYSGHFIQLNFRNKNIPLLLKSGFPMLLFTIIGTLTMYVPRVILERLSGDAAVGIFTYVFAPTIAISTFAVGVTLPFVPHMALMLKQRNVKALIRSFILPFSIMFFVGLCAILVSWQIGDWVLFVLYNSAVARYKTLLVITMAVSTLWSLSNCCNNFFIVVRSKTIIWVNAVGLVSTVLLCFILIPLYGMYGAGYAMTFSITLQLLLAVVMVVWISRRISHGSQPSDEVKAAYLSEEREE